MKKEVLNSVSVRDRRTNRRLCDLAITKNNRIVIIDIERDRDGKKEELIGDITDYVIMLCKMITK